MTIDSIRRASQARRARKGKVDKADAGPETGASRLPVPVDPPRTVTPPRRHASQHGAEFTAQVMGQGGEKRGLRGGATAIDTAKATYNKTEWSGAKDRRARKGRITKTDV
ncbi:MAG: hypothetical protein ABI655_04490 [Phenylobacterium sp.]